ncbi:hypothetical protein [Vulgatibacter incomptus]|uniref:Outer membrane protein beta-barrel domain-containing protein n=1 Tax=Vulgatibacter incomptus TaxID=1391653 RepID=A0A0K1PCE8_9BACT|nr:hypothetical protein [Vulgatibacter incomptus]AKU90784.1 hypothetical protein AKJ08_1171 [Vulgatibacter incomptus]
MKRASVAVLLGLCLIAPRLANAEGVPTLPIELYAGAGFNEWAHVEANLRIHEYAYLAARAGLVGAGDGLVGGGIVAFVPLAKPGFYAPTHAILLGLSFMKNPNNELWVNDEEDVNGYGEATLGYGYGAESGFHIRLRGGAMFDKLGYYAPVARLSVGWLLKL